MKKLRVVTKEKRIKNDKGKEREREKQSKN